MEVLPYWLYKYIMWGEDVNILEDPEDFPFEVTVKDLESNYDEVVDKFENYITKLGLEVISRTLVDCDLDDGYETYEFVIKLEGNYFKFKGSKDRYGYIESAEDVVVTKVRPVEKLITVYEAVVVPV